MELVCPSTVLWPRLPFGKPTWHLCGCSELPRGSARGLCKGQNALAPRPLPRSQAWEHGRSAPAPRWRASLQQGHRHWWFITDRTTEGAAEAPEPGFGEAQGRGYRDYCPSSPVSLFLSFWAKAEPTAVQRHGAGQYPGDGAVFAFRWWSSSKGHSPASVGGAVGLGAV